MSLTLDRLEEIKIVDSNGDELAIDGSGFITANINGTVTVTASDLDIRDLTHVSDSVKIGDGVEFVAINASNEMLVKDTDATALLTTIDADTSLLAGTVSGTELQVDIVAALPAGDNNIGNVDIVTMPAQYDEDAAHSSGDKGNYILGVRQDADTSPVSADGDYHGLIFNALGALKVAGDFEEDSYDSIKSTAETVGVAAAEIVSSPLANRKRIMIQNNGTASIFVGPSGVTVASGIEVSKRSTMEFKASATADIYCISGTAGQDVRVFEMAA